MRKLILLAALALVVGWMALTLGLGNVGVVGAEIPPDPTLGRVEGTGTHFEVTDSEYLNITLDSSETIHLFLESVPEIVTMHIESASGATTAQITLGGFAAGTTYYKYEDDDPNYVAFTTDEAGSYSFTQDLSTWHLVDIQTETSTKYIYDGDMNGHCDAIGTWDSSTKTCTQEMDVYEHIGIMSDGITLDGNGYMISIPSINPPKWASLVGVGGRTGVTLKNLDVWCPPNTPWGVCYRGIGVSGSTNTTLTGNTVSNTSYGIHLWRSDNNTFVGNTLSSNTSGILAGWRSNSNYNSFIGNTFSNNEHHGIKLTDGDHNTIRGNTILGGGVQHYGFYIGSSYNVIYDNTISGLTHKGVLISDWAFYNTVYNNNFSNNGGHIRVYGTPAGTLFNLPAPTGGNWFDTFYLPGQGCYNTSPADNFCDAPYTFSGGQDNLPWTTENGWANSPPVSDPNGPYLGAMDAEISFDGTASSDPDGDALSYDWAWGDTTASSDAGATPTHAYGAAGIYDVCLTVTDPDGASDTACTIAVVYDPSGGFVTGGGWIDSPVGAYIGDPALTGKANFGFVSKYKKGAEVPTGNTEFQFHSADLNFHSDSYEWLVVTGSDYAMLKGVGAINGTGEYKFKLWAGDNEPDTFRIKIWTEDEFGVETVVYDNGTDQALSGGSIKIHKK